MGTPLYDEDILLWSEQQAGLLRRLARGERVNDAVDWENVIEEVGEVGRSELNAVQSLLEVGLRHLLLAHGAPRPELAAHWAIEAETALADAARRFSPSMAQRITLDSLWRRARRNATRTLAADGAPLPPLPEACPFVLPELLVEEPDADLLLTRLAAS